LEQRKSPKVCERDFGQLSAVLADVPASHR
jgi:hypothetical protein